MPRRNQMKAGGWKIQRFGFCMLSVVRGFVVHLPSSIFALFQYVSISAFFATGCFLAGVIMWFPKPVKLFFHNICAHLFVLRVWLCATVRDGSFRLKIISKSRAINAPRPKQKVRAGLALNAKWKTRQINIFSFFVGVWRHLTACVSVWLQRVFDREIILKMAC